MKHLKLFFLLILLAASTFGQNKSKIDSLKIELNKPLDDNQKQSALIEIFNGYLFINLDSAEVYKNILIKLPSNTERSIINKFNISSKFYFYKSKLDSSLFYTKKALDIALKLDDNNLKSDLYRKMAILSSRNFNYEDAEKYGKLALETAQKTKNWTLIASSNIMLGNQYYKKTQFDLALSFYLKADSLYTSNNTKDRFLANCYDNISSIYTDLKDKKALYYITKSSEVYKHLEDEEGIAYSNLLKGIYYNAANDYKPAISNFEKAITFYKNYGATFRLNDAQTRLINSYAAIGNYKEAKKNQIEAEKNLKNIKVEEPFLRFFLNSGQLYLDLKDYDKAIVYYNKAYDIVSKNENDFSIAYNIDIKKGLKNAYLGKKDYKTALKFSQLQLQIADSIQKKNNIDITKELETKYQTEKKEQEIALLKSKNELVAQQKTNQLNQLLVIIGITTLAGLVFFFLYRNRQKTTKKLKELDKAKSTFFANISHEFRTPLTMISGPLQSQLQKENLTKEDKLSFEMMYRNSNRLLSLVDQILSISKIKAGNLQLQVSENEIITFIGVLTSGFTIKANKKEINYLVYSKPSKVTTFYNTDIVEKIIVNLLSNAIKYTPKKGSIVCNTIIKEDKLYFTLKNTGKGLSKNEINTIFERFYQVNENSDGVGIGLALVKELVTLNRGTITVESIQNEWTTFKLILPITKESFTKNELVTNSLNTEVPLQNLTANNTEVTIENEIDENEENPILLIVDDNNDIRTYVTSLFKDTYNVLSAKNGQEGIDLALEHIPDIIISDIMMPIKNGIELCNNLKVDERTSHIPIILLTAKAGEENEIEGIKTGADDYVTKPFNEELLKIRVEKLLENRKKIQLRYSQEVILRPKDIAISSFDEQFLERVQNVLDDKLVESSFSIQDFSDAVGLSRMQLHRKLKALTGLSASAFIRSQRLKLAAQLLENSEINVSQVGYSVGFNDHAYFSKCFKELYHCTPSEYIKKQ